MSWTSWIAGILQILVLIDALTPKNDTLAERRRRFAVKVAFFAALGVFVLVYISFVALLGALAAGFRGTFGYDDDDFDFVEFVLSAAPDNGQLR